MNRSLTAAAVLAAVLVALLPAPAAQSQSPSTTAVAARDDADPSVRRHPARRPERRPKDADAGQKAPAADDATVLVRLRPGRGGAKPGWRAIQGTGWFEVAARSGRARALLAQDPSVAQVAPHYLRSIDVTPNDPMHKGKWGPPHYLRTIRAPAAWDLARAGSGQTIAVLDTGVALSHQDLKDSLLPGRDFVNADAVPSDDNGHGTAVAGVAAARANNGRGLAGVAWRAKILPVKVLAASGLGRDADIAKGIVWATDQGADVINMSFGGSAASGVLREAIAYAAQRDVVLVAAAGNSGIAERRFPASHRNVIGVGATDWDGNITWFSTHGGAVDIAAPGYRITSTAVARIEGYPYTRSSGTSMAAPMVAGGAALLFAQDPGRSARNVAWRLLATARDTGLPGDDSAYGAGVLDVRAALDGARRPAVVAARDEFEPNGFPQQAKPIPVGSSLSGTISPENDVDWYVYEETSDWWLQFTVQPPSPQDSDWWTRWGERAAEADVAIAVYGADLRLLGEVDAEPPTQTERLSLAPNTSTRYYIKVTSTGPARSPGPYSVGVGRYVPNHADTAHLPYVTSPVDGWASSAEVADATGDGRQDVLVTSTPGNEGGSEALWVYRQRNDGFLSLHQVLPLYRGLDPNMSGDGAVTTGDFDGDGSDDAVASSAKGLSVFWQRNGGLRGPSATGIVGGYPIAANLDGGARDEVVLRGVDRAFVARWTTSGWVRRQAVDTPTWRDAEVLDVTGDGTLDLVTLGLDEVTVRVHRGRGDGTFATGKAYALGAYGGWGLAAGDVTGDGRNDVVVSGDDYNSGEYLRTFAQRSDGLLAAPVSMRTYASPQSIDVADVNKDGRGDVVVLHGGYQAIGVHEQRADGTLGPERLAAAPYATHYVPHGLAVEDFTGDGYPDIAVADYNHGLVVLRRNSPSFPPARPTWVLSGTPDDGTTGVASSIRPSIRFGRALDATTVTSATVRLLDGNTNRAVPATVAYDAGTRTATVTPAAPLLTGRPYRLAVTGVRDSSGLVMEPTHETRFLVGALADTTPPQTTITGGPTQRSYAHYGPFFGFAASEPGTRFECRWPSQAWLRCTSPTFSSTGLGSGDIRDTFEVRAIDGAGNVDPTPAAREIIAADVPRPPNDYFGVAATITGASGSITGTTDQAVDEQWEPIHAAPGGASVWYRWKAPFSGPVVFDTQDSQFDTLLGVYTGSAIESLTRVAADDDRGKGLTSRVRFNATEGRTYRIAVDGFYDGVYWSMGPLRLRWAPAP